ncbi:ComEC/Rec2 family competence protein [Patescibacteria group bacterium]
MLRTSRNQPKNYLRQYRQRIEQTLLIIVITVIASGLFILDSSQTFAQNQLQVWFFDVGQGDAIFIRAPGGEQILIDGGPDSSILSKLGSIMLPWDREIDVVMFTHPDADHISGLIPVLERYQVKKIYETGARSRTQTAKRLDQLIKAEPAEHIFVTEKEELIIGELKIDFIHPEKPMLGEYPKESNDSSLVIRLDYGQTSILLVGDATLAVEERIGQLSGDIDVLKVGHHGSLSSTGSEFLNKIDPEFAVIQVGLDNRYNHPHPAVYDRLLRHQTKVFRTDQDGDILLLSDLSEPVILSRPLPF